MKTYPMNCREIKHLWQSLPPDRETVADGTGERASGGDENFSGWEQVSAHLDACEQCRAEYSAERHWNELLTRSMLDVSVPAGLAERIQARLAESSSPEDALLQPVCVMERRPSRFPDSSSREVAFSRRKLLRWGTVAAAGLAAVGGSLWWWGDSWSSDGVALTDLADELTGGGIDWNSLLAYEGSVPPLPSRKEMAIPEAVRESSPLGLKKNGRQIAALYHFPAASLPDRAAAEIVLAVLDRQRTRIDSLPSATSFGEAEFLYLHDRAVKIWGTASTVFCCFATATGTAYLEALQPRDSIA